MPENEDGISGPEIEINVARAVGSDEDPLIGTTFDSRYEILQLLGLGATGAAYRARDVLLDRFVALKILHLFLLSNKDAVERFKNEAFTSIALSHNNIVRVYNQGISSDGRLYLSMDCLDGISLAEIIAKNGKLEFALFCDLFLQVIDALAYAHEQGVVHRDIKPNNIVILDESDGSKKAVLLDFGVAKLLDQSSQQEITKTAALIGSSSYMSPEQCVGGEIDCRSDIYSLGCVMLEALTGKAPFRGQSALDVMYKHLNESAGKLGFLNEMPEKVSRLIAKCLRKDKTARYQNMSQLRIDFQSCSDMRDTLKRKWTHFERGGGAKNSLVLEVTTAIISVGAILLLVFAILPKGGSSNVHSAAEVRQQSDLSGLDKISLPHSFASVQQYLEEHKATLSDQDEIALLKRWVSMHNGKISSPQDRVNIDMQFAKSYALLGDSKQAAYYASKVISKCKHVREIAEATAILSEMYCKNGQPETALALIDRNYSNAVKVSPGSVELAAFYFAKGQPLMSLSRYEDAAFWLKKGLQALDQNSNESSLRKRLNYWKEMGFRFWRRVYGICKL